MTDFYDDAILSFDAEFDHVLNLLRNAKRLQNTIVIFYSDHGIRHSLENRVPLLFLFPNRKFKGRIGENVQLLDVAPTLLDYIGVPQPHWMTGKSLISKSIDPCRPVWTFSPSRVMTKEDAFEVIPGEPFGTKWHDLTKGSGWNPYLGAVGFILCNQHFSLELETNRFRSKTLSYANKNCVSCELPDTQDVIKSIQTELLSNLRHGDNRQ